MKLEIKHDTDRSRIAAKGGSYSLAVTAIVLAILVAVNILVSALPTSATKYDITSTNLYSITSSTKVVVNALEKDVNIYWIVQADEEDEVIENLLGKYESLSSHITVTKKNPDVFPTFTSQYTDEDVPNNSLIVECGDKSRYISYNDIYLTDVDYTTYSYVYSFDGEGAITSAIDYVISDELPKIYTLEGHGEEALPGEFQSQIEKENMELESFSLLNTDEVPDDADALLIYAPQSDISEEEAALLEEYLEAGGKLLVIAGPTENGTLTNLYSILASYGVEAADGIVVESDREHYAFQQPYILLPDIASSDITDPLLKESYYAIIPIAQGLTITGSSASALLTTSDSSFSKIDGFQLETYEKEEGDIDGPFAVAVSADTGSGGQLIWFSSSYFLEDVYNAYFLLIMVLRQGIRAAALTSCISISVGTVMAFYPFFKNKLELKFVAGNIPFKQFAQLAANGSSEFFSSIAGSIFSFILNVVLLSIGGATAVAAMSVVMYVESLVASMLFGMVDSMQPAISYCKGAGLHKRVWTLEKYVLTAAAVLSVAVCLVLRYCGTFVVPFFVKPGETELLTLSIHAMRLYALSYLVNWIDGCLSGFLTALGQAGRSFVVSITGTLVLPLAGLAVLVPSMGLDGVCLTPLLSGTASAVLAIVLVMTMRKGDKNTEIGSEKHL